MSFQVSKTSINGGFLQPGLTSGYNRFPLPWPVFILLHGRCSTDERSIGRNGQHLETERERNKMRSTFPRHNCSRLWTRPSDRKTLEPRSMNGRFSSRLCFLSFLFSIRFSLFLCLLYEIVLFLFLLMVDEIDSAHVGWSDLWLSETSFGWPIIDPSTIVADEWW